MQTPFLDKLKIKPKKSTNLKSQKGKIKVTTEEKEQFLSLADLVYKGHKNQLLESNDPNGYGDKDFEFQKETTKEYYKWIEELN